MLASGWFRFEMLGIAQGLCVLGSTTELCSQPKLESRRKCLGHESSTFRIVFITGLSILFPELSAIVFHYETTQHKGPHQKLTP